MNDCEIFTDGRAEAFVRSLYLKTEYFHVSVIGYQDFRKVTPLDFYRQQSFYSLHWVIDGKGYFYLDDKEYCVSKNDVFLCTPDKKFKNVPVPGDEWRYVWISVEGAGIKTMLHELGLFGASPVIHLHDGSEIAALFRNIFRYVDENKTANCLGMQGAWLSALAAVSRNMSDIVANRPDENGYVNLAKRCLRDNLSNESFRIEDLSGMMNLSHSYLCKVFKRNVGVSIKAWMKEQRMKRAAELLITTEFTVVEVCYNAGYRNYSHFCTEFVKYWGVTAGEYRRRNKL